jgi:hypothetical protein
MTLFKRIADGFAGIIVGLGLAAVLMGPAAMALVFPGQYAPRYFPTQQTHYERHVINLTSSGMQADTAQNVCVWVSSTCSIRIGAVPYNSFIVRAYQQVVAACTGSTACGLSIGTSSGSGNLVANQSVLAAGGGTALTVVAANVGIAATGNNIASTGADGGFDLYVTGLWTVAAPTGGTIVLVIEYFGSNDGGCATNVALAATAGPC